MKMEVEFRGLTKNCKYRKNGEWIYGFYMNKDDRAIIVDTTCGSLSMGLEVDPETIGQYVCLTDKNGKKVYIDDIIKTNHNFYPYRVFVRECKVCIEDKYGNAIRPTNEALKHFECEVIGNIHNNPELLEIN